MNCRTTMLFPALVLALTAAGCGPGADAAPAVSLGALPDTALLGAEAVRIAGLRVEPVRAIPWQEEWSGPARLALDPAATQQIGSIVEGRVMRVLAQPGEPVRAGQLLMTLHSPMMLDAVAAHAAAGASLVRAGSEARLAESAAARAERLYEGKALSLVDLERARAAAVDAEALLFAAKAESERAAELLTQLTGDVPDPERATTREVLVRSPLDGVVVSREVQPGQVVVVGAPLLTVSRTSSLQLVLNLPESMPGAVAPGAEVHFSVQANPGREWRAVITRVAPTIDPATRTMEVLAQVAEPTEGLRAEMYATARIRGPETDIALVVPVAAVQALDGDTVLIVAEQRGDGMYIRSVPVRIGRRNAETAEVLEGVDEETSVVVQGAAIARAEILRRREAGSEES